MTHATAAPKPTIYHFICAVMANGCRSAMAIDGPPNIDVNELDPLVPEDRRVADLLRVSGWWMDHGKWVCGNHEPKPLTRQEGLPDD